MDILGLDPGSRSTGYGLVRKQGSRLRVLESGHLSPPRRASLGERLAFLSLELERLLDTFQPDGAALEAPFQGLNPRSLIVLAQARGALLAVLARRELGLREYTPTQVKTAVTGYGRASKRQVADMVGRILKLDTAEIGDDESDALAVAICCAQMERHEALLLRRGHGS